MRRGYRWARRWSEHLGCGDPEPAVSLFKRQVGSPLPADFFLPLSGGDGSVLSKLGNWPLTMTNGVPEYSVLFSRHGAGVFFRSILPSSEVEDSVDDAEGGFFGGGVRELGGLAGDSAGT